jgi:hypothetical protein
LNVSVDAESFMVFIQAKDLTVITQDPTQIAAKLTEETRVQVQLKRSDVNRLKILSCFICYRIWTQSLLTSLKKRKSTIRTKLILNF